ncbi:MAG TPA: NAD(P)/FAD-dependent oxidoreductase [Thermotogota bacterium]|nr:NAD(P)/FAD-dependent oxidoreductase [Thermotogota bacterium]HPR96605.1 NAD(P)/FAD-dependent oxidoreductase [Thermotogota bacterium]
MKMLNLKRLSKQMSGQYGQKVICSQKGSSILLEGNVAEWTDVVAAGKMAAEIKGIKGVINKIECASVKKKRKAGGELTENVLKDRRVDVLIIGGGIIGCSIARELSKWDLDICLVEKEPDLAMHASSRNDGMIHPGLVPSPGSMKAKYNAKGNGMYETLSRELDFEYKRVGSLLLFDNRWLAPAYPILASRAEKNGVPSTEFLTGKKLKRFVNSKDAPSLNKSLESKWAVYIPSTGIVSPYKTTIAVCENAILNGTRLFLNTEVLSFERENDTIISCKTTKGDIHAKIIINCAGTASDEVAELAGDRFFTIHPRKGTILMIDRKRGHLTNTVLSMPNIIGKKDTKGGGIVPTVEGNLLVGPDAEEQPYKEDYSTSMCHIDAIVNQHFRLLEGIGKKDIITYFAGTRASTYLEDFIVEWSDTISNLFHVAGIQSPGLASAPAIAEDVSEKVVSKLKRMKDVREKVNWQATRKGIPRLAQMDPEQRSVYIIKRPDYGEIVCRCEEISKGEIRDALHSPIPVKTVDGVKRRVRAGMGRCQGGFCKPLVVEIIAEELQMDPLDITKKGQDSYILMRDVAVVENEKADSREEGDGNVV